ncbi:MAG: hypothetical protein K8I82_05425 [Anaerolineae bacterium]|nr:hypothetical protein [Anaerolineae bacterium]
MRHLIFTFLFVLRVFAGNQSLLNAQVSEELYAYLAMLPNGMVAIQAVNPRNLTQVSDLAMLPINGGEYVGNSYLSPTGNWLLFEVTTLSSQKLRLFNLLTGETIDMLEDVQVAESPPTLSGPPQNISWSLNGRYFAINYAVYETNRYGVYLYDTQTHTLTNLTMPDSNHFRLAWSNDSTRLATTSMICGVGECSRVAIDIFDAATGELTASIDVKNLSSGPGGQYTNFCQLTWSPSNTYIAFVDQCDNSLLGGRKEVSIASLNTFTVIQSTDFTPTNLPTQEIIFQAFYDISWADDSKLLIGAVFQEGVMSQSYEPRMPLTHIYNISNDTAHAVSAQQLGGWSRASATLFGYHAYIYPQNLTPTSFPVSANVVVSAFDGQSFNTVGSGPSGCHLAWNTEKTILAYVPEDVITLNNCSRNGTTIYFLNAVNGNLTSFSSGEGNAIALGWVTLSVFLK